MSHSEDRSDDDEPLTVTQSDADAHTGETTAGELARQLTPLGTQWVRLEPATVIKHYEMIRSLARGGMSEVHLARDVRLGRLVALKFLIERMSAERFIAEARATAWLTHENI